MPSDLSLTHKFTAQDYGWAFLQFDPELLDHALHLALHSIRVSFAGADCTRPPGSPDYPDPESLYHDLQAAAELTKLLAVAADPVTGARLGDHHDRRSLMARLMDKAEVATPTDTTKPRPRKPAKKGARS